MYCCKTQTHQSELREHYNRYASSNIQHQGTINSFHSILVLYINITNNHVIFTNYSNMPLKNNDYLVRI